VVKYIKFKRLQGRGCIVWTDNSNTCGKTTTEMKTHQGPPRCCWM
jgi:hypothetical protein